MNKVLKLLYATGAALTGLLAGACTQESPVTYPPKAEPEPVVFERGAFAKGADVSWVTQLEAAGYTFQNRDGQSKELMTLLRDDCGVNSIRLRVWVEPGNDPVVEGWCDINDVLVKARRASALGMRLMIDFHFSDTWADPGKQYMPAAWEGMSLAEVKTAMAAHVTEMLGLLQANGIEPEWVQIGNETRTGMMWPLGSTDNGDNFTQMLNAGYDAVKSIFPEAAVIVHVDCGNESYLYDYLFGKITAEGARYDMIGMSLYPEADSWQTYVDDCVANIARVQKAYGKPVMLCEIGMDYDQPEAAGKMMSEIMAKGKAAGLQGIFWWEPEAPVNRGYRKGCFDENGAPTEALNAFIE